LALALGALVLNGCFTHDLRDARYAAGTRHQEWTNHFFWGLVGHETVDAGKWCGGGEVAGFGTGANGGTWFVSLITLGIYSPKTVWVDCSAGPTQTSQRLGSEAKL
jgi:hypothetical protein